MSNAMVDRVIERLRFDPRTLAEEVNALLKAKQASKS